MRTTEQKVQTILGQQIITICELQTQIEQLTLKIAALEKKRGHKQAPAEDKQP